MVKIINSYGAVFGTDADLLNAAVLAAADEEIGLYMAEYKSSTGETRWAEILTAASDEEAREVVLRRLRDAVGEGYYIVFPLKKGVQL